MFSTASLWLGPGDPDPVATIRRALADKLSLAISHPHGSEHSIVITGTPAQIASIVDQLQAALAALPTPEAVEVGG